MKTSELLIIAAASGLLTSLLAAPQAVSLETIQRIESLSPAKATAPPAKPRKVMIFCIVTGWRPPAISLVNKTFEILGKRSGAFEIAEVSEDASVFTPAKLADFDAIGTPAASAATALQEMLQDSDAEVRRRAAVALRRVK